MAAARDARWTADQQAAFFAALVRSSDIAIIGKRLDGTITSWNHAAEALYGYTEAEIVGRPITLIVPADRHAEIADILERVRRGERVRLSRVIDNLLANAIKYGRNGSCVKVTVARTESEAVLELHDEGVGIPAGDLPRMFEWFRRGSNVGAIVGTGVAWRVPRTSLPEMVASSRWTARRAAAARSLCGCHWLLDQQARRRSASSRTPV